MTFFRKHRTDANSKEIAGYFTRLGFGVHFSNTSWDLTVWKMSVVKLIEIRDPEAPDQKRLNSGDRLVKEKGCPIRRCLTLDDVMAVNEEVNAEALRREQLT